MIKIKILLSVLILLAIAPFTAGAQANNLTGLWVGEYSVDGMTNEMEIKIVFTKTWDYKTRTSDQYLGITSLKETKNSNITYASPGDKLFGKLAKKPQAEMFIQTWVDNPASSPKNIRYRDVVQMSGDENKWCLKDIKFEYFKDDNGEYLNGTMTNCSKGTIVKLKRLGSALDDKEKTEIAKIKNTIATGIQYTNFQFESGVGDLDFKPDQKGTLSLNVVNNTPYNIKSSVFFNVSDNAKDMVSFVVAGHYSKGFAGINTTIPKGKTVPVKIFVATGFEMPPDTLSINASIESLYGIAEKAQFASKSRGFFNKPFSQKSNETAAMMGYFLGKPMFNDVLGKIELQKLSLADNKKAIMWQCLFEYTGQNGYPQNEDHAIYSAKHYRYLILYLKKPRKLISSQYTCWLMLILWD